LTFRTGGLFSDANRERLSSLFDKRAAELEAGRRNLE
jgi:hypothetical protein